MTTTEWDEWQTLNRLAGPSGVLTPCADCTPDFAAEMTDIGRCDPDAVAPAKVPSATHEGILALHAEGLSNSEVARRLGIDRSTVHAHLIRERVLTKGERAARAKAHREELLRLRSEGHSVAAAARIVGINESWARKCIERYAA